MRLASAKNRGGGDVLVWDPGLVHAEGPPRVGLVIVGSSVCSLRRIGLNVGGGGGEAVVFVPQQLKRLAMTMTTNTCTRAGVDAQPLRYAQALPGFLVYE